MITINTLAISADMTEISVDVSISPNGGFYQVLFYTKDTFKEVTQAIDITSLLGTIAPDTNEVFTITAADVGLDKFLGAFWVEFFGQQGCTPVADGEGGFILPDPGADDCDGTKETLVGAVANIIGYKECALDKALSMQITDCDTKNDLNAYAISALIDAFDLAFTRGYTEDSIKVLNRLDALCRTCVNCPDYGDTVLVNGGSYQTSNNSIIVA